MSEALPEIGPATALPSVRESVELVTQDGLRLVGELALPVDRVPVATLVTLHPLPTAGGMMDSHVFRKAANRLPALADVAVLRFNTRGTESPHGRSEGSFAEGDDERFDVEAAVEFVRERELPNVWIVGWSFGTELALRHGLLDGVVGTILLSPPLRKVTDADLDRWAVDGRPVVALIPELDDYLRPTEAFQRFARVPQAEIIAAPGVKHLWVGEKAVRLALGEIVRHVAPAAYPLDWRLLEPNRP